MQRQTPARSSGEAGATRAAPGRLPCSLWGAGVDHPALVVSLSIVHHHESLRCVLGRQSYGDQSLQQRGLESLRNRPRAQFEHRWVQGVSRASCHQS